MSDVKKIPAFFDRRLFYALCLPVVAMISALYNVFYQTNDDQAMRLILEGALFSPEEPSEYVIFINIIYARFLKYLYEHFENFFWYDFFFYILTFISSCTIAYSLFVKNEKAALKILVTIFLFVSFRTAFNQIQFSIVAGISACSATVVLIRLLFFPLSKKETVFGLCYIPVALFLSSLVRPEMTGLTLFTGGALCLVSIGRIRFSKTFFATVLSVTAGMAAVTGAYCHHRAEYAKVRPFDPLRYNDTKSRILDKAVFHESRVKAEPYLEAAEPVLAENGWSRNDLELFLNRGFTGRGFFDQENIQRVADAVAPVLQGGFKERYKLFFDDLPSCERYLHLIVLLMILFSKGKGVRFRMAAAHLIFLSVFLGLTAFFKPLPVRVYFSLNLLEFCFLVFLTGNDFGISNATETLNRLKSFTGIGFSGRKCARILFAFLIGFVIWLYPAYVPYANVFYDFYKNAELPQTPDVPFVPSYYQLRGSILPFRPFKAGVGNFLLAHSWTAATPAFQKQIDGDFYGLLMSGKVRFLDFYNHPTRAYHLIEQFWKEHYGKDCKIKTPESPDNPNVMLYVDCR